MLRDRHVVALKLPVLDFVANELRVGRTDKSLQPACLRLHKIYARQQQTGCPHLD